MTNCIRCFTYYNNLHSDYCSACYDKEYNKHLYCDSCKDYKKQINNLCITCYIYDQDFNEELLNKVKHVSIVDNPLFLNHIKKLWIYFKSKNNLPHIYVSDNQFDVIMKLCKNKKPNEIYNVLNKNNDFPPILLTSRQADKLYEYCRNDEHGLYLDNMFSIYNNVLDIWNSKYKELFCYYRQRLSDNITEKNIPTNINEILYIWKNSLTINLN